MLLKKEKTMLKSETIGKLTEALSKAQACIKGAITDSENPYFKSRYADLSSVWEACRIPLTDNGLAIIQTSTFWPENPEMVVIETTLSHSSGEFVTGVMAAKPVKPDPQSIGSCVTYLRRYSLAAICGVAPEDDDGNAATGKTQEKKPEPTKPSPQFRKESKNEASSQAAEEPPVNTESPPASTNRTVKKECDKGLMISCEAMNGKARLKKDCIRCEDYPACNSYEDGSLI
jgi:hypothetical protein